MGGSGVDGKKRAKKAGKNGRSNKWVAGNKQQTRKKWTLQMPVVSSTAPAAPWLSQRENSPGSEEGNKVRKILPALALPEASLRNLDKELLDFCTYVRLSESEIACRLEVVKQVQLQCGHLFGVSSDSIKVFGSFACLSVCTFASDIDLAIHDVVKVEQPSSTPAPQKDDGTASRRATKRQRSSRTETETTVAAAAAAVTDPNQKKQQRVLLWKAILEEAEDRKQQNKNDEDVPKTTSTTGVDASLASTPQKSNCATMIGKSTASGRRVEITHVQALPMSAEQNEDGMPLFVIDREGSTDEGDPKSNEDDQGLDAAIDASVPGEEKKEEDTAGPEACEVVSQKVGESAKQMDESTDDKDDLFGGDEDDSGGDSADILATLKTRGARPSLHEAVEGMSIRAEFNPEKKEVIEIDDDSDEADEPLKTETRPRSRSLISLCSATTCSDTEDREWDDSGMEVSFVSNGKPKAQLPEFTEEERVKVVRALNALGKRLRGALPLNFMHVRKRARVPIINMETRYGFECDIAVGGHQGMDTSGYAIAQCQRFHRYVL